MKWLLNNKYRRHETQLRHFQCFKVCLSTLRGMQGNTFTMPGFKGSKPFSEPSFSIGVPQCKAVLDISESELNPGVWPGDWQISNNTI